MSATTAVVRYLHGPYHGNVAVVRLPLPSVIEVAMPLRAIHTPLDMSLEEVCDQVLPVRLGRYRKVVLGRDVGEHLYYWEGEVER